MLKLYRHQRQTDRYFDVHFDEMDIEVTHNSFQGAVVYITNVFIDFPDQE
jgi:hypothetical protein